MVRASGGIVCDCEGKRTVSASKRRVGSAAGKVAVCEQDGVLTRAGHEDDAAAAGARVLRLLARRQGEDGLASLTRARLLTTIPLWGGW
jgi:hypothetical protein